MKTTPSAADAAVRESVDRIVVHFHATINPKAKVTEKARKAIRSRLKKVWIEQELLKFLDCYAKDSFWMGQHGNEPIAWVFESDERVERVLGIENLPKRTGAQNGQNDLFGSNRPNAAGGGLRGTTRASRIVRADGSHG